MPKCQNCGAKQDPLVQVEGELLCNDCHESHTFICENCGSNFFDSEVEQVDGRLICPSCQEGSSPCCYCEAMTMSPTTISDGSDYCPSCSERHVWACELCDETFGHRETHYRVEGNRVCENCFENNTFTCEDCDETYVVEGRYDAGDGFCTHCCGDGRLRIHDYGFKPTPKFLRTPEESSGFAGSTRYFGVELEVDAERGASPEDATMSNFYYKRDGSLDAGGVELVTHPMSLKYHQEFWSSLANEDGVLTAFNRNGDKGGYGIHVHTGKFSMDDSMMINAYFLVFAFTRNKFKSVFRRMPTDYCPLEYQSRGGFNTGPEETDEFRGFKTSNKVSEIVACVELVDAIVEFSEERKNSKIISLCSAFLEFENIRSLNYTVGRSSVIANFSHTNVRNLLNYIGDREREPMEGTKEVVNRFCELIYANFYEQVYTNPKYKYLPALLPEPDASLLSKEEDTVEDTRVAVV